jgi:hypothetical protein
MTTYTKRTNAKRAAVKAGIREDQVEITVHKEKGEVRFGFKQNEAVPVPAAQAAPAAKPAAATNAPAAEREQRNGVKRPRAGGACAQVWSHLDSSGDMSISDVKVWATANGLNPNNAAIEIYQWRKFTGINKELRKAKN